VSQILEVAETNKQAVNIEVAETNKEAVNIDIENTAFRLKADDHQWNFTSSPAQLRISQRQKAKLELWLIRTHISAVSQRSAGRSTASFFSRWVLALLTHKSSPTLTFIPFPFISSCHITYYTPKLQPISHHLHRTSSWLAQQRTHLQPSHLRKPTANSCWWIDQAKKDPPTHPLLSPKAGLHNGTVCRANTTSCSSQPALRNGKRLRMQRPQAQRRKLRRKALNIRMGLRANKKERLWIIRMGPGVWDMPMGGWNRLLRMGREVWV
jgi:hypothetical protein